MKKLLILAAVAGGIYLYSKRSQTASTDTATTDDGGSSSGGGGGGSWENMTPAQQAASTLLATQGRGDGNPAPDNVLLAPVKALALPFAPLFNSAPKKNISRGKTAPVIKPRTIAPTIKKLPGNLVAGLSSVW